MSKKQTDQRVSELEASYNESLSSKLTAVLRTYSTLHAFEAQMAKLMNMAAELHTAKDAGVKVVAKPEPGMDDRGMCLN
jgi:hypothetical protein